MGAIAPLLKLPQLVANSSRIVVRGREVGDGLGALFGQDVPVVRPSCVLFCDKGSEVGALPALPDGNGSPRTCPVQSKNRGRESLVLRGPLKRDEGCTTVSWRGEEGSNRECGEFLALGSSSPGVPRDAYVC